jgi:SpoVK/Ycf46/Vps4 family AAA+-type ATPase
MPKFWNRIASEYKAASAHQFLLHFNVNDLADDEVYGYLPMLYYLMEQLNALGCDLVIGYSPSEGVIWPNVNRWKAAQNLLGLLPHGEVWAGSVEDVPPIGEFRPDGVFVPRQIGAARLRATVGEVSIESRPIEIAPGQIERLEISPPTLEIPSGQRMQFILTAYDRSNAIRVRQAEWRVIGEIGTVTSAGVFTGTKAGKGKLRARVGNITAESGEITVVPGRLAKLRFESLKEYIFPGEPVPVTLIGEDASGNPVKVNQVKLEAIGEDEINPQRTLINSKVVHWKLHEDQFLNSKPVPDEELRKRLDSLLQQGRAKVGMVINFVEKIIPNAELAALSKEQLLFLDAFQSWAMDLDIRLRRHIVLLVTQNLVDVHSALLENADMLTIQAPFPAYEERLAFINHLMNLPIREKPSDSRRFSARLRLADGLSKEQLARETVGLNLFGIHDIALQAEETRQPITRELAQAYRRESVAHYSRGLLELITSPYSIEVVGGLEHVVNSLSDIVAAMREGDLKRIPRGILFLGQPGSGKTLTAELLGRYSEMAVVRLRGAREAMGGDGMTPVGYRRNLSLALHFIRAVTPVIVFIDNIELAGASHSGAGREGSNSALPVELLNMMGDAALHGKVLWIGASNRPDLIDPAFRKRGLFDEKLVFLHPTQPERADILGKLFKKHQIAIENINLSKVAGEEYTKGLSGGDLERIVRRSYSIARRNNRNAVAEADLIQAVTDYVPEYSPEMNEFTGLLALREANSRSMIPKQPPPEFQGYLENNRLNKTKIDQRLIDLRRQLALID